MFAVAKKLLVVATLFTALAACVSAPVSGPVKVSEEPMKFEPAVRALAASLMRQLKANQSSSQAELKEVNIAVEPIVNADTAEVTEASRRIQDIISDETQKQNPKIRLAPTSPDILLKSQFILVGIIKVDAKTGAKGSVPYKVGVAIIDLKTNKVLASATAQVSDNKLDVTPTKSFQDNPMYTKDRRTDGLVKTVETGAGGTADTEYMNGLVTSSILAQGDREYDKNNYENALNYYKEASLRSDGQTMRTYAALYQAYRQLNKLDKAEAAFGRLLAFCYVENNINVKLMFSVGRTEFVTDSEMRSHYYIWLRQIAKLFAKEKGCLEIVGHTSRTGSESYNESLSLQRARYVQGLMLKDFPGIMKRSTAIGRGFKENIIGTGSDNMRDAIDRRVEFKITSCR
jgi:outer membrane protein OmpA-like peptidoglycan-associated protein